MIFSFSTINKALSTLLLLLMLSFTSVGQLINSTYSRFGIGLLQQQANAKSSGLSGLQAPIVDAAAINPFNPASYSFIETTSIQFSGEAFSYKAKSATESLSYSNAMISEMSMVFRKPTSKWGFAVGMHPYSRVGYVVSETSAINDSLNALVQYTGSGGINEAFIGASRLFPFTQTKVKVDITTGRADTVILHHNFSIGTNMNYLFGNITHTGSADFDQANYRTSRISKSLFMQGILFQGGVFYQHQLSKTLTDRKESAASYLQMGISYTMGGNLRTEQNVIYESAQNNLYSVLTPVDTSYVSGAMKGHTALPQYITAGLAWKSFNSKRGSLLVGLQYTQQDWSKYKVTIEDVAEPNIGMNTSVAYSFGLDYRPVSGVKDNLPHRMQYRLGAGYRQTPLQLNGEKIMSTTVSAGLSIPLLRTESRMHLSGAYSITGTTDSGLIEENQFSFWLGFTLVPLRGKERWFHTYQYD